MSGLDERKQENISKLIALTIVSVFILGAAVYFSYRYSQFQASGIVLPGGVTYLGNTPTGKAKETPPTSIPEEKFQAVNDDVWENISGLYYQYSFSYPSPLSLTQFPNDIADSVAIEWKDTPPEQNVLLNIEVIEDRDPQYIEKPKEEYVKNWHTFFSGLKSMERMEIFTNSKGLKGYRANYLNLDNISPNVNVFFEVKNRPDIMIHLANGVLEPELFDKIVDSVSWNPNAPVSPLPEK